MGSENPVINRVLERIKVGVAGAGEAEYLRQVFDALNDQIQALKVKNE